MNTKLKVGDTIVVAKSSSPTFVSKQITGWIGKVVKVLEPKAPSPGGLVVDTPERIFYVAPWERFQILTDVTTRPL